MWDDTNKRMKRSTAPAPDYRAGSASVSASATSVSVTFSSALASTNYAIICTWMNTVDSNPQLQPFVVTAFSTSGFTVSWNAPTDTANYKINWQAIANG
jgi:hypothetical protein